MDLSQVSEEYFKVVSKDLEAMREIRKSLDDENSGYYKFCIMLGGADEISVYKKLIDRDIEKLGELVETMKVVFVT